MSKVNDFTFNMHMPPVKTQNNVVFFSEELLNEVLTKFMDQTASKTQIYSLILFFTKTKPFLDNKYIFKHALKLVSSDSDIKDYRYQITSLPYEPNDLHDLGVQLSEEPSNSYQSSESSFKIKGLYFCNDYHFVLVLKAVIYSLLGLKVIQFEDDENQIAFLKSSDFLSSEYLIEFVADIRHGIDPEIPLEVIQKMYITGLKVMKAQRMIFPDVQQALRYVGDTYQSERFNEIIDCIKNAYSHCCSIKKASDVMHTYIPDSNIQNPFLAKRRKAHKKMVKSLNDFLLNIFEKEFDSDAVSQLTIETFKSKMDFIQLWIEFSKIFTNNSQFFNSLNSGLSFTAPNNKSVAKKHISKIERQMHQGDFGRASYFKSEHQQSDGNYNEQFQNQTRDDIWIKELANDQSSDSESDSSDEEEELKDDSPIVDNFNSRTDKVYEQYTTNNRMQMYESSPWNRTTSELLLRSHMGLGFDNKLKQSTSLWDVRQRLIPRASALTVAETESAVYAGKFIHDGNYYAHTGQDMSLNLLNTYDPANPYEVASIDLNSLSSWTITDIGYSEQSRYFICGTMSHNLIHFKLDPEAEQTTIPVLKVLHTAGSVFSCDLSKNGSIYLAGQRNGLLTIGDINHSQSTNRYYSVQKDVNSVRFVGQGEVLVVAGSDDAVARIYDRRTPGLSSCFVLAGHSSGITHAESNANGNYILTNSKDQTIKLWDLRNVTTTSMDIVDPVRYDYRTDDYMERDRDRKDGSLMTYTGHYVRDTLIKCHFSPQATTGEQYIYSGSADNRVYIWSIDGKLVSSMSNPKRDSRMNNATSSMGSVSGNTDKDGVIRDVSWHPHKPALYACCGLPGSTVNRGEILYIPFNQRYEVGGLNKEDFTKNGDETSRLLSSLEYMERHHYDTLKKEQIETTNTLGVGTSNPLVRDHHNEEFIAYDVLLRKKERVRNRMTRLDLMNGVRQMIQNGLENTLQPQLELFSQLLMASNMPESPFQIVDSTNGQHLTDMGTRLRNYNTSQRPNDDDDAEGDGDDNDEDGDFEFFPDLSVVRNDDMSEDDEDSDNDDDDNEEEEYDDYDNYIEDMDEPTTSNRNSFRPNYTASQLQRMFINNLQHVLEHRHNNSESEVEEYGADDDNDEWEDSDVPFQGCDVS